MKRNLPVSASILTFVLLILTLLAVTGCRTPEPVVEEAPQPVPEPVPEPVEEPDPFITDWAGTTWIFRDAPKGSREFPGYRGFHLGRDGRLLLVNLDEARGDTWSAAENILTLTLAEKSGEPGLPVAGELKAYITEPSGKDTVTMRLVPEGRSLDDGLVMEQAKANIDIVENHWIPREMRDGNTVPWPVNKEIFLMLLPDAETGMGVLGYGGVNRFKGSIRLGPEEFVTGALSMTRKIGPASNFENIYVRAVSDSNRYVQVDDDLFLYEDSSPLLAFRVRLWD